MAPLHRAQTGDVLTGLGWSTLLQWTRLAGGALVFLVAARFLSLAEFGIFAAAFAPVRVAQMGLRGALVDAAAIAAKRPASQRALRYVALGMGGLASLSICAAGLMIADTVGQAMTALALVPFAQAIGAVPEGRLRAALKLRALAHRTGVTFAVSGALTLWLLGQGAGLWALVTFAVATPCLSSVLACAMVRNRPIGKPNARDIQDALRRVLPLVGRDAIAAAPLPLAQAMLAAFVGLPAAGAFQLASRLAGVLDGLAIAPLRYFALPTLRKSPQAFWPVFRLAAGIALLVFPAAFVLSPWALPLVVGADHAPFVQPLVLPFCLWGGVTALSMPFVQRAAVQGVTHLAVIRATVTTCGVLVSFGWIATASAEAAAWACALVSLGTSLWFGRAVARATALPCKMPTAFARIQIRRPL